MLVVQYVRCFEPVSGTGSPVFYIVKQGVCSMVVKVIPLYDSIEILVKRKCLGLGKLWIQRQIVRWRLDPVSTLNEAMVSNE